MKLDGIISKYSWKLKEPYFYAHMIYKGLNINRTVNLDYYNNKCVKV